MKERLEIPVLEGELRRGDDVALPFTEFSVTLTGFTFDGNIYNEDDDVSVGVLVFGTTDLANGNLTITVPAATTTLMVSDKYYSWVRWTDTSTKKLTFLKIIWEMVG